MTDYRALARYLCDVSLALFSNDAIDDIERRLPTRPDTVDRIELRVYEAAPERVSGMRVFGSFRTSEVMPLDVTGARFDDRHDEIEVYLTPMSHPEHLGARVSMAGQPGMTVGWLDMRPETVKNRPGAAAPAVPATVSDPEAPATTPPIAVDPQLDDQVRQPEIGSPEPVPSVDLGRVFGSQLMAQLAAFWDCEHFEEISIWRQADPGLLYYGLPPSFVHVVRLGTGGMTIGYMVDAPELGFADDKGCLFEYSSGGVTLSDASVLVRSAIWRSLTEKRIAIEAQGDTGALERWIAQASVFAESFGYDRLSRRGLDGFAWGDKRRKPERSPRGTKWRTDAGGNGVLAASAQWGSAPLRRPRTGAAALDAVSKAGGPAHRLHILREALVIANRTMDAELAARAYESMVEPLVALDRPTIAARAEAMAGHWHFSAEHDG